MEFQQVMIDVVRYLAAFTATEAPAHIGAARKLLANYAHKHGGASREFQALWDVTITMQRHIYKIGVGA
jgi:hypothetical protein